MTGSHVHAYLQFGRRVLIQVLMSHPYAVIKIPTETQIEQYEATNTEIHPLLHNVCVEIVLFCR
jgi:hypothetical protein